MKVKEIMTDQVHTCRPEDPVSRAARLMLEHECGILPVINRAGNPIGVITDRDICMGIAADPHDAKSIEVIELMSSDILACLPNDDVKDALQTMQNTKVHRLPVVDYKGKLVGILSLDDVAVSAKGDGKGELPLEEIIRTYKSISEPFNTRKFKTETKEHPLLYA
jgi:CBS domain-containing protein